MGPQPRKRSLRAWAAVERIRLQETRLTLHRPRLTLHRTTADDNTNAISSLPSPGPNPADWAEDGNPDPVPDDKISTSIRGHRVFVQTSAPTSGLAGDVWIRDLTTSHPAIYEHSGTGFTLDYSFFGARVHYQTSPLNVAMDSPQANRGDILFEFIGGTLTLYRRGSGSPYWVSIGTVTGGGGGGTTLSVGALAPYVEAYALHGTSDEIPSSRFPFAIPSWLANVFEVLPDSKLPIARLVPDASAADDGMVAKVSGGEWTIGDDESGGGGGGESEPLVKSSTDVTRVTMTEAMVANVMLPTANVAVDSGIAVPPNTVTLLLNYGASLDTTTSGIDLLWFPIPIEEWDRLEPVDAGDTPDQDSARFTRTWRDANIETVGGAGARQVWLLKGNNGNIFLMTDNTVWGMNPFRVRFEMQETISVISDVTGGGGGGGGLTADGITAITAAPDSAIHSNAVFPGVFGGILQKFSFANLIALMRSTVGLGRQINPGGSTVNLGKVPVVHEDGTDFHYQLQKPAELPSVASDAPTNPAHLHTDIIYKDTAENVTANELYYKRKHDRESVIIAINDTSPRSFGTEHRSFGWTSRIILDTAEPVPGVTPYPSVPTHWEAFLRVQNIASGLVEWRLYTDELFTTLDTIYLDMRDQDDPDTHIQNAAMTKPINEAYWSTGTFSFSALPFLSIAGRGRRPVIRIRTADDTLSTSIIHLIPQNDVREAIVDEDRLHSVYADLLDILQQHIDNLGVPTIGPMQSGTYTTQNTSGKYSATGFTPPNDWTLVAVETRPMTQAYGAYQILDLEFMRSVDGSLRPAAGDAYPDLDGGAQSTFALSASGELLATTFTTSALTEHLLYRRLA